MEIEVGSKHHLLPQRRGTEDVALSQGLTLGAIQAGSSISQGVCEGEGGLFWGYLCWSVGKAVCC